MAKKKKNSANACLDAVKNYKFGKWLSGNSSAVEHNLPKVGVAGSNPVSRSISETFSFYIELLPQVCTQSVRAFTRFVF